MSTPCRLLCTLLLVAATAVGAVAAPSPSFTNGRHRFTADWVMGDRPVTLPRAFNEDEAFRVTIAELTDSVVWYHKVFDAKGIGNRKVFIEFEGVRQAAEVYFNGHLMGIHEDGITAFGFDLTPYIKEENNILDVKVDNDWRYHEQSSGSPYQWNDRNFNANYGGITKRVWLHVTDRLHHTLPLYSSFGTVGPYVYATDFDLEHHAATLHFEAEVENEDLQPRTFALRAVLTTAFGSRVGEHFATFDATEAVTLAAGERRVVSMERRVSGLDFWSWGYGALYDVDLQLMGADGKAIDSRTVTTGFRQTDYGHGLFRLNGRVLMVHGYAQRTTNEWPALGIDIPEWMSDYSNRLQIASGGNLVRWMHIAPSKQDIESCDRVGLLEAMPAGDSEADVSGRRWEQRVEVMRNAIVYNRNNPSIVFYECGNKGISEEHMQEMMAVRDAFDPHGGRAIGSREMLGSTTAEYGGEMLYINKSAHKPVWAMEYCRDEGVRKYRDARSYPYHREGNGPLHKDQDASPYNHNQDEFCVELVRRWYDYWQERPGTGERVSSGGVKIIFSDTNTHSRGSENYRRSGVVDAMRLPKDAFYAHQVMWSGWVEPEQPRTYIVGPWDYEPGTVVTKQVVSTGSRVELFLDGRSLGDGQRRYDFLFTFPDLRFEPGTLTAVSYDDAGRELSRHSVTTAAAPHHLQLTVEQQPAGWQADGSDVALVTVEVVDADGRRCPLDDRMVSFSLSGPAEWRGGIALSTNPKFGVQTGDGQRQTTDATRQPDAANPNYILAKTLPVECGVNRVALRSTLKAGRVTLTATAPGLPPQHVTLVTVKPDEAAVVRGLRAAAPLRDGDLEPVPLTAVARTIPIVAASANSDESHVRCAFDDNELTQWSGISTAAAMPAATFTFDGVHRPAEAVLKLQGWRSRRYPIDILVTAPDGTTRTAWSGLTPQSLGYVHLPLDAEPATAVIVRLQGDTDDRDAFGLVELSEEGKARPQAKPKRESRLSILEIEFKERL